MGAVIESFAINDLLYSFITNRVAVPLALDTDLEVFDLCDEIGALVV